MIQLNAFTCIFIKSSDPTADKIFFFHDDQIPNTNAWLKPKQKTSGWNPEEISLILLTYSLKN